MCRYHTNARKMSVRIGSAFLVAGVSLVLAGCGEGRDMPRPPQSPPRPVTNVGKATTAQLILDARPVPPKPGMM